ncbi:hypothetical protein J6590_008760 [Homalodisca vitripennis]|nr:hypothetical protein J6590_008760 [Homalodisca vitripennis]
MNVKGQRAIPRDVRDVICKLYVFMKKEAIEGPILLKKVQERVALAVGVSRSSVQRILREENKIKGIVDTTVATTSKIINYCKTTIRSPEERDGSTETLTDGQEYFRLVLSMCQIVQHDLKSESMYGREIRKQRF